MNTPKVDQPVPEVLYFCTTCGGTLQNDENGRWRRRLRPSSAPAAPGRRDTLFDHPPNWLAESREDLSRATATADGRVKAGAQGAATPRRLSSWGEGTTAKLKYAPCARIIQHAYRDFRHRQYLRDWASALVRVFVCFFFPRGQTQRSAVTLFKMTLVIDIHHKLLPSRHRVASRHSHKPSQRRSCCLLSLYCYASLERFSLSSDGGSWIGPERGIDRAAA